MMRLLAYKLHAVRLHVFSDVQVKCRAFGSGWANIKKLLLVKHRTYHLTAATTALSVDHALSMA